MHHELSPRQREILEMAAEGQMRKQMALTLGISQNTVKVHVAAVLARMGAQNMTEAVAIWTRERLAQKGHWRGPARSANPIGGRGLRPRRSGALPIPPETGGIHAILENGDTRRCQSASANSLANPVPAGAWWSKSSAGGSFSYGAY